MKIPRLSPAAPKTDAANKSFIAEMDERRARIFREIVRSIVKTD